VVRDFCTPIATYVTVSHALWMPDEQEQEAERGYSEKHAHVVLRKHRRGNDEKSVCGRWKNDVPYPVFQDRGVERRAPPCAIERDSPFDSFATRASLVSSASAAKIGVYFLRQTAVLGVLGNVLLDVLHLLRPSIVVHAERLALPMRRDHVKSRLREHEQRAARNLLQPEFYEGSRLA
jgi:hypothetical protein